MLGAVLTLWWMAVALAVGSQGDERARWEAEVASAGLSTTEVVYPFTVTDEMAAWAAEVTRAAPTVEGKLAQLQRALFDPPFVYDRDATSVAAETFATHRGNCLAFTTLFVALARSVGIPAQLGSVDGRIDVGLRDDLWVMSRHVVASWTGPDRTVLYDFTLQPGVVDMDYEPLEDVVASGMFHNNLGASALRDGRLVEAEAQLVLATRLVPELPEAWVNLGVTRRRAGDPTGAAAAFTQALVVDPGNASALTDLAVLYEADGRTGEAEVALRAAARDRSSPYAHIALADLARAGGDLATAHRRLTRARLAHPRDAEVLAGLSRWATDAGRPALAEHLRIRAERLRAQESEVVELRP